MQVACNRTAEAHSFGFIASSMEAQAHTSLTPIMTDATAPRQAPPHLPALSAWPINLTRCPLLSLSSSVCLSLTVDAHLGSFRASCQSNSHVRYHVGCAPNKFSTRTTSLLLVAADLLVVLVLRRSLCRFTTVFHATEISFTVSRDTESPCPKLHALRQSPSPAPSNPPSLPYLVASYCLPATPSCVVAGVVAIVVLGTSSVLPSRCGDLFLSTIRR
ncbi:uncharacterized protein [Zea mays]|uniref:uncharacterized protein n=1 Tax=Zea mays TaxID=4577 RepID=UPI0004DEB510|nr:uncharacterized protein LOC103633952 [Zea mays]|eukprot:XP_008653828.1 uncharacterized protein LOC103633952 [Zea mays]